MDLKRTKTYNIWYLELENTPSNINIIQNLNYTEDIILLEEKLLEPNRVGYWLYSYLGTLAKFNLEPNMSKSLKERGKVSHLLPTWPTKKTRNKNNVLIAYFDASFNLKTSDSYIGFVVINEDNKITREEGRKVKVSDSLEAEFCSLFFLLEFLSSIFQKDRSILIFGDSQPVINALHTIKQSKNEKVKNWVNKINPLLNYFKSYELKWIPRNQNYYTDWVCQRAEKFNGHYKRSGGNFIIRRKYVRQQILDLMNKAIKVKDEEKPNYYENINKKIGIQKVRDKIDKDRIIELEEMTCYLLEPRNGITLPGKLLEINEQELEKRIKGKVMNIIHNYVSENEVIDKNKLADLFTLIKKERF